MKLYKILLVTGLVALLAYESESWFWGRRRRRRTPPPCKPKDCVVGPWQSWGSCSKAECGIQKRQRYVTVRPECNGRQCPWLKECRGCNVNCKNGGILRNRGCICHPCYRGVCCEHYFPPPCTKEGNIIPDCV